MAFASPAGTRLWRGALRWLLAVLVPVALVSVLAHDLWLAPPASTRTLRLEAPRLREYHGVLELAEVTYEQDRRVLTATIRGRASRPWRQDHVGTDTPVWVSIDDQMRKLSCVTSWFESLEDSGRTESVRFVCANVALPSAFMREDRFYPFDQQRVLMHLRVCVGDPARVGCTADARNVDIDRLDVQLVDRTSVVTSIGSTAAGDVEVAVGRTLFVRFVSLTFALLACLYLFAMTRIGKPDDLMKGALGFFGALWGVRALIVPPSIRVFPTLFDYGVFALFTLLFALVFVRWQLADGGKDALDDLDPAGTD